MAERVLVAMKTMQHKFSMGVWCLAACSISLGKPGWQHRWVAILVVLLEDQAMIFRVETQSLAFISCFENPGFL
jgi:hypothetical protein